MSVIQESVPAGAAEVMHYHNSARQFFYILEGEGIMIFEDHEVTLKKGQGIEIAPQVKHQFKNQSNARCAFSSDLSPIHKRRPYQLMTPIIISQQTARRFVLGKQGLWPGRRWKGKKGTAEAMRACEAVQLDPLNVAARSQDIVLHSRVLDYKPEYLYQVAYKDRQFFDYGGWLAMYPMAELPYWRVHMEKRSRDKRVEDFMLTRPELFEQVRSGVAGTRSVGEPRFRRESHRLMELSRAQGYITGVVRYVAFGRVDDASP